MRVCDSLTGFNNFSIVVEIKTCADTDVPDYQHTGKAKSVSAKEKQAENSS